MRALTMDELMVVSGGSGNQVETVVVTAIRIKAGLGVGGGGGGGPRNFEAMNMEYGLPAETIDACASYGQVSALAHFYGNIGDWNNNGMNSDEVFTVAGSTLAVIAAVGSAASLAAAGTAITGANILAGLAAGSATSLAVAGFLNEYGAGFLGAVAAAGNVYADKTSECLI